MSVERLNLIKKLRHMTHAGFADCGKALKATNNDIEKALDWLKQHGIAKAQTKTNRQTREGLTNVLLKGNRAILYSLQCETDFVSRNHDFVNFFQKLGDIILNSSVTTRAEIENLSLNNQPLNQALLSLSGKIGENIILGSCEIFTKTSTQIFGSYIHGMGKSSALVILEGTQNKDLADSLAMHLVAMQPLFLSVDDVPEKYQQREINNIQESLKNSPSFANKDSQMLENIVRGKYQKQLKDVVLLMQNNIHKENETIAQTLAAHSAKMIKMGWITKGS